MPKIDKRESVENNPTTEEEEDELAYFLAMEKEVLQEEMKNKGLMDTGYNRYSLRTDGSKAKQNMENVVCNKLLNQTGKP